MERGKRPPNIVFMISDHHRWDYMGCAGNDRLFTPNLDALAARGTLMECMYSTSPLCVPQRIALTSGRYCFNTGRFTNRIAVDPTIPTFLHSLRKAGFYTAMVGKFHHHVHALDADFIGHEAEIRRLGFNFVHETSGKVGVGPIRCECRYAQHLRENGLLDDFRGWTGTFGQGNGTAKPNEAWLWDENATQDAYIADQGIKFINSASGKRPFFLHLGFVGPHPPFDAPQRYRDYYREIANPLQIGQIPLDARRWFAYAACISEVDYHIGRVLTALRNNGMGANTVVFYTSDHGDNAGDCGRWGKVNFYEGSVHVPFLAAGPGIAGGKRVGALAELIDFGKTACAFGGCESHEFDQGLSLKPVLRGETELHRPNIFSEMGSDKMLYDGHFKLMYGDSTLDTRKVYKLPPFNGPAFGKPVNLPPDRISLYDLRQDPHEEHNRVLTQSDPFVIHDMKEKLLNRLIANMQSGHQDTGSVL